MKKLWRQYAVKIDAWSPRARMIAFFLGIIGVIALMTTMFIEPSMTRAKLLSAKMLQTQRQTEEMQVQILALQRQRAEPQVANMARRKALQGEVTAMDTNLKNMQKTLVPAAEMNTVLQEVLSANSRLQLISMTTLPVQPLVDKSNDKGAKSEPTEQAAGGILFKHGVEVKIQGSYADLYDYLVRLEKLPAHMLWARASLNAEDYPRDVLTITLYTLSLDKAWLAI